MALDYWSIQSNPHRWSSWMHLLTWAFLSAQKNDFYWKGLRTLSIPSPVKPPKTKPATMRTSAIFRHSPLSSGQVLGQRRAHLLHLKTEWLVILCPRTVPGKSVWTCKVILRFRFLTGIYVLCALLCRVKPHVSVCFQVLQPCTHSHLSSGFRNSW